MPRVVIHCGDPCRYCNTVFACGGSGAGAMIDESDPLEQPGDVILPDLGSPALTFYVSDQDVYNNNQDDPDGTLGTAPDLFQKPNVSETQQDLTTPTVTTPPVVGCDYPSGFNWSTSSPIYPTFQDWARSTGLSTNYTVANLTYDAAVSHYTFTTSVSQNGGYTQEFILENLCYHATEVLEGLRSDGNVPSFVITSGYRNKSGTSQHNKGQATDLQFPSLHGTATTAEDYYNLAFYIRDNFDYDQLILEWFGRNPWIHISSNSSSNRGSVLTQVAPNSYASGLRLLTA